MPEEIGLAAQLDMSGFNTGMTEYEGALNRMVSATSNVASTISSNLSTLGAAISAGLATAGAVIGGAAIALGKNVVQTGFDFDAMKESASIGFTTMLKDGEKAKSFLDELEKFAARTPFEFKDLTSASQKLLAMGINADQILPTMTSIGDAVAGLGGNAGNIDAVVRAIGQMNAKGKVQAQEMMQLTEQGIPAWQILAETLGTDVSTAMDKVTKKEVDATTAIPALLEGMNKRFGGLMEKQAKSWQGLKSTISDNFAIISGTAMESAFEKLKGALQKVVDLTASPEFLEGVKQFGEWLGTIVEKAIAFAEQALPKIIEGVQSLVNAGEVLWTGNFEGGIFGMTEDDPFVQVLLTTHDLLSSIVEAGKFLWTGEFEGGIFGLTEDDPLIKALGAIHEWIGKLIPYFSDWTNVITAAGIAVGVFLAPLAQAVLTLAAVAAGTVAAVGIMRQAWTEDWGGIQEFVAQTWAQIQGIIETGMAIVSKLFGDNGANWAATLAAVWEEIKSIINTSLYIIQQILSGVLEAMNGNWAGAWAAFQNAANSAWALLKDLWNETLGQLVKYLGDHWEEWSKKLGEWALAAWQWLVEAAGKLGEKLGEWWGILKQYVSDHKEEWATKLGEWATAAWQWIVDAAGKLSEKLGEWFGLLKKYFDDHKAEWVTKLSEWAAKAWEWITDAAGHLGETLANWFTLLKKWFDDNKAEWGTKLAEWAKAAWTWITDAAGKLGETLGDWFAKLKKWFDDNKSVWMAKLLEWGNEAWQWIVDASKKVAETLDKWYAEIKKWLDANLPKFQEKLKSWTTALLEWITNTEKDQDKTWLEWYGEVQKANAERLKTFLVDLVKWTDALVNWIGNAVPGAIKAIGDFVTSLVTWMTSAETGKGVGSINTGLTSWVQAFKDWISGPNGLITQLIPEWTKLGGDVVQSIIKINDAITAAKAQISAAFTAALVFVGTAIVDGIKQGLSAGAASMTDAVTSLGTDAIAKLKAALGIQSPSTEAYDVGDKTTLGFVNAVQAGIGKAVQAASDLAQGFLLRLQTVMAEMPNLMRNVFDQALAQSHAFGDNLEAFIGEMGDQLYFRMKKMGQDGGAGFLSALDATISQAQQKMETLMQTMNNVAQAQAVASQSTLNQGQWEQMTTGGYEYVTPPGAFNPGIAQNQAAVAQVQANLADLFNKKGIQAVQSSLNSSQIANTFGPNYINTAMDWAELEFRIRNIMNSAI